MLYDRRRDELVFAATETPARERRRRAPSPAVDEPRQLGGAQRRERRDQRRRGTTRASIPRSTASRKFATRNLLSVPLFRRGRVIGVLEVANRHGGGHFEDDDRAQAGSARAREVERRLRSRARSASTPRRCVRCWRARCTTAPSEAAALLLLDPAGHELVFRASRTIQSGLIDGMRLPSAAASPDGSRDTGRPCALDDVASDPRHYRRRRRRQTGLAPRTMICVPMISRGTLRECIQILNKVGRSRPSPEAELSLAQTLADHAAIAIENASLYRQAYRGLDHRRPDRARQHTPLSRSLADVLGPGRPRVADRCSILDNFKAVVDRYGHLAGSPHDRGRSDGPSVGWSAPVTWRRASAATSS